jgi:hypothetical protein
LNRDSQPSGKSAFSLVSPDTAKRLSGSSTGDRIRKSPDHQNHLPMQWSWEKTIVEIRRNIVSFYRSIVCSRFDGLIILQAENLTTSESPVPGNRKRGWDRGIQGSDFLSFTDRWPGRTIQSPDLRPMERKTIDVTDWSDYKPEPRHWRVASPWKSQKRMGITECGEFNFLSFTTRVMAGEYLFVLWSWQKTTVRSG